MLAVSIHEFEDTIPCFLGLVDLTIFLNVPSNGLDLALSEIKFIQNFASPFTGIIIGATFTEFLDQGIKNRF